MNQNAELSQTRPPSRREANCEPLWRYQDLAHALPPRPHEERSERPEAGRRAPALHFPAARRPRRSGAWR